MGVPKAIKNQFSKLFLCKKQQFCKAIKSVVWVFQKLLKVSFLSWFGNEKQQFCKAMKSVVP